MAKPNTLPTPTTNQEVLPAFSMDQDAGKGVSQAQEDNLVPLIYILQPLSPQVNKRNSSYIEGAEPGGIWLRNAPSPLVSGEEGFDFQPCYFTKDWVEWVPRDAGGGFIARHRERPEDAKEILDPKNPNRRRYVRPNGNEVIETRYHIGYAMTPSGAMPYVIPMSSTGHTFSREFMFRMNSASLPSGKKAPSFAKTYRLKTKERTNSSGTWFTWTIVGDSWVQDEAQYKAGRALHEAFLSGEKQVDAPEHEQSTQAGDSDVM